MRVQLAAWVDIDTPDHVVEWILHGFVIPWEGDERPSQECDPANYFESSGSPHRDEMREFVRAVIREMVIAGAARPVASRPRIVCPLGVVPKHPGSDGQRRWRLIHDLRVLNGFTKVPKFGLDSLANARELVRPRCNMFSVDLASGYYHCEFAESATEWMGFEFEGQYYVMLVLPFGARFSPYYFCEVMRVVTTEIRRLGVPVINYVDDFGFFCSPSRGKAVLQRSAVLDLFEALGLAVSADKSVAATRDAPFVRRLKLLGFWVNSETMRFEVDPGKLSEAEAMASEILRNSHASARRVAQLCGRVLSLHLVVGKVALLYTRYLYSAVGSPERREWSRSVDVSSDECRHELEFIARLLRRFRRAHDAAGGGGTLSAPIVRETVEIDVVIASDASESETGAWIRLPSGAKLTTRRVGGVRFEGSSSAAREVRGVYNAVFAFSHELRGKRVLVRSDATAACAALTRGASAARDVHEGVLAVHELAASIGASLVFKWWSREVEGAREADEASKTYDAADVRCSAAVLCGIERRFGVRLDADLFASADANAGATLGRSMAWCSRWHYRDSLGDAFARRWDAFECPLLFPPFALIGAAIGQARRHRAKGVMILPVARLAPWYSMMLTRDSRGALLYAPWVHEILALPRASSGAFSAHSSAKLPSQRLVAVRFDFSSARRHARVRWHGWRA